ncbi:hypothetical protein LAZ67_4000363 [Cordylochernes scorpioides]|uniref:PIPK domain-containing protein n=1 Tax=Cordylochernes scorpioides TaxID=51811 RepID=A0ABY6KC44_9ARAC|nr:hypothetical protein LAZ67_4000363 [Cordylochernes scorpioides]
MVCVAQNSLTKSQPLVLKPSGRAGPAKFYESYDHLFVIKTLVSEEVEQMHSLLKQYHPYVVERHGKTLLPQYLGLYRLTVDGTENYFVVMRNIFSSTLRLHRKYDLKVNNLLRRQHYNGEDVVLVQGSTVDREASDKEKEKDCPTLKDNDFVRDGTKMYIGPDAKEKLLDTLESDLNVSKSLLLSR